MSNRPDGITRFTSYEYRFFEGKIKTDNLFEVFDKTKQWIDGRDYRYKKNFEPCFTREDVLELSTLKFRSCIKISGYILNNIINDFDIFEELYSLFETLFVEFKQEELLFMFKGFDECKIYKIENKLKTK